MATHSLDSLSLLIGIAHTLAVLVAAGIVFFMVLVGRGMPCPTTVRTTGVAAGAAAALLSVALLVVTALRVSDAPLSAVVDPDAWVPAIWWQLAAVPVATTLGLLLAGIALRRQGRAAQLAALAGAAAAASTPVLLGHTQAVSPRWLLQSVDVVHLLAAAVWAGGALALVLCLRDVRGGSPRGGSARGDARAAASLVAQFSRLALVTVTLLIAAGLALAFLILDAPAAIVATAYGRTLIIKVVLVGCIGAAALWNRRRLLPMVSRQPSAAEGWAALRHALALEALLLLVVIVISGLLANSDPHLHAG